MKYDIHRQRLKAHLDRWLGAPLTWEENVGSWSVACVNERLGKAPRRVSGSLPAWATCYSVPFLGVICCSLRGWMGGFVVPFRLPVYRAGKPHTFDPRKS